MNTAKQSQLPFLQEEASILSEQESSIGQHLEQSQRDCYHFGVNSAAEPNGYRYQITNLDMEAVDTSHLYNILAGKGHFEKSDGSMLNVVQMIAEGFNEAKALRTLVHESFTQVEKSLASIQSISSGRFANLESQLDQHMRQGRAGSTTQLEEVQALVTKIQTDHGIQISKLNTQLTAHLTERTRLAEALTDLNIKTEILDKQNDEIHTELGELKRAKPGVGLGLTSELVEYKLEQLQAQITNLAQGLPPRRDPSPKIKDVKINSDNLTFNSMNKNTKVKSNKLGNKPSK
jgi:hypothetical protein